MTLTPKGVHQLTSQELSFLRNYADMCSFVKTYRGVLKCLASNDSLPVTNMDAILTQSKRMKGCFKELYNLDADFYCKILFFVNNKFQLYPKSCYFNKPIDDPAAWLMNFHQLWEMLECRYYAVSLPMILRNSLVQWRLD